MGGVTKIHVRIGRYGHHVSSIGRFNPLQHRYTLLQNR